MEDLFTVGEIVNTQGIKGEVRVIPQTDDITRFELLKRVFIQRRGAMEEMEIQSVRYHKQFVLLKFKGFDNINDVEKYKGCEIKIPAEEALPCGDDEYYIRDLYGLEVFDEAGGHIGTLSDILFTGANDVYAVSREGKKDLLLPAIKSCILDVDIQGGKMTVKVPEGLE